MFALVELTPISQRFNAPKPHKLVYLGSLMNPHCVVSVYERCMYKQPTLVIPYLNTNAF